MINPLRLLWIEGSLNPHKVEGHHGPSHIDPLIEVASGERKGRLLKRCPYIQPISRWLGNHGKEVCGFPNEHLIKRTRERCPHILALANTRTALCWWWENSDDITRILLTTAADPLARQGAEMSDTIALCTRILLTTQDPHSKELDHGGSSRAKGTRGGKQKGNIIESLVCSRQGRISIYSRSGRLNPSACEAIVLSWSFKVQAHKQTRMLVGPRSRFSTHDYGPIRGIDIVILD